MSLLRGKPKRNSQAPMSRPAGMWEREVLSETITCVIRTDPISIKRLNLLLGFQESADPIFVGADEWVFNSQTNHLTFCASDDLSLRHEISIPEYEWVYGPFLVQFLMMAAVQNVPQLIPPAAKVETGSVCPSSQSPSFIAAKLPSPTISAVPQLGRQSGPLKRKYTPEVMEDDATGTVAKRARHHDAAAAAVINHDPPTSPRLEGALATLAVASLSASACLGGSGADSFPSWTESEAGGGPVLGHMTSPILRTRNRPNAVLTTAKPTAQYQSQPQPQPKAKVDFFGLLLLVLIISICSTWINVIVSSIFYEKNSKWNIPPRRLRSWVRIRTPKDVGMDPTPVSWSQVSRNLEIKLWDSWSNIRQARRRVAQAIHLGWHHAPAAISRQMSRVEELWSK